MKISREIKTGIIVLGGILLFILGFSYLKSTPLFDNSKTFYAVYHHVGGLQSGTQVTINGFTVGKVNDIKFNDASGNLLVTFTVDNGFTFSKNSNAELYDTGIIGGKGIQIKPVFDDAAMAKSGDTLPSSTRPGLTELVQQRLTPLQMKVEGAVTNADSLLMNVNDILDVKTKKDLRESIAGLNVLVKSFQGSANSLNQILTDNKDDLEKSISNLGVITDNFNKLSDTLANAGLGETIKKLQYTMGNINDMMAKIEGGEGSLGKLVNDKALYNNLADASRELDLLLQDFRLNPKRYVNVSVFGKKQIDYAIPEEDPAEK
ncbi:MlaD family protein [Arenibacter echinorum]|uniref:Phospholipid/cholesterol/gamma-HCH transport system substrate-binding protein n=1 Tax=Arenibacter echinorum TaxID=440515 RepID=A0A327RIK9_9FLAO|nr:MlaD family protein [Arenibacter echinorum]RAJ16025.1 phospholipid/cholesterol/gamma-HCH transport system substrate-binding protein [Arenibacter echinorum]